MKENKIKTWVKTHKKELLIAGGVIVTAVGTVLLIDNMDAVKGLVPEMQKKALSRMPVTTIQNKTTDLAKTEPITKIIDVRERRKGLQVNEKELDLCLVEGLV